MAWLCSSHDIPPTVGSACAETCLPDETTRERPTPQETWATTSALWLAFIGNEQFETPDGLDQHGIFASNPTFELLPFPISDVLQPPTRRPIDRLFPPNHAVVVHADVVRQ